MKWLLQLFEHYKAYHAEGPPRLKYMGLVAATGCVLFYFVRFTRPDPALFDDMAVRLTALLLFGLVAAGDQWPERLKRHYLVFSYAVQLLCLPCFTILIALQRGGGIPSISNLFIMLVFLLLSSDWRNTLVMLAVGCGLASLIYALTSPDPKVPMDLVAQLPAFAYIVVGTSLFKISTAQMDTARKLRATRALAGSIAHEMRNPLAQLSHHLQSMLGALPAPTTRLDAQHLQAHEAEALYNHVAQGEMAIHRGLQVISMTLDEVGARPLAHAASEYLWAAQTVRRAVEEHGYESPSDRSRIAVLALEDFCFRGNETTCFFVLFNLLRNGLSAIAGDEHAGITITVAARQVRVRDTGPGIAAHRMARLFEPFETAGKAGGTGLGLAYCHRAMQAMGGTIACESREGSHTEFILQFPPLDCAAPSAPAPESQAGPALAGRHALVVDDDPLARRAMRATLHSHGLLTEEAADGEEALALMSRRRYDLLVLDLHMAGLDGYAVAARVRQGAVPLNREVCIVAHSAQNSPGAVAKARRGGMNGFVAKSASGSALTRVLIDALTAHRPLAGADRLPQPTARQHPPLAGRKVLLADDNSASRKSMASWLEGAGAQVVQAAHGGEALTHIERLALGDVPFDAVLLDLHMPVLDGLDTARAIRRLPARLHRVALIALTAREDAAARDAAREAGIDDFLTKPVEISTLNRLIARLPRPTAVDTPPLLDLPRLQTYRRMHRLDELLDDYLPEIQRLAEKLPDCARRGDRAQCLEVLHSLLGMSGEAGALALYQAIRKVYRPLLEDAAWPAQRLWAEELLGLTRDCSLALRAHARPAETVQTPN